MTFQWLNIAKEIQSIAQAGLTFCDNKYDIERYKQLRELSVKIMHEFTEDSMEKIYHLFAEEEGYQTPKVDIRGVVFRNGKILMIQETIDGLWSLPGGWADVNYSPFEIAAKEIREEAGLDVIPLKLLAVFDKMKNPEHLPDKYHVYKMFILCKDSGQEAKTGMETLNVDWFLRNNIPPLSLPRVTSSQIKIMFEYYDNPMKSVMCD